MVLCALKGNYTLERDGRELQHARTNYGEYCYYTLERDGRELQLAKDKAVMNQDYTLERDGRELQPLLNGVVTRLVLYP